MKKILLLILISTFLISCDAEEEGYYRFKITSTGNKFFGEYTINGKDDFLINESDVSAEGNYFIYKKNLSNPKSIHIKVDGIDAADGIAQTSRISIEVYENSELKKEQSASSTSNDSHLYVTLYYEFEESDEDSQSDSSDNPDTSE